MSLDTLADIERPLAAGAADNPERSLANSLEERLNALQDAVASSQSRIDEQGCRLEDLRRAIGEYSALMERLRLQTQLVDERSAPAPVEAEPLTLPDGWALEKNSGMLQLPIPPAQEILVGSLKGNSVAAKRRPLWARALPYAALALVGLGLGLEGRRHPAQARLSPSVSALPAPQAPALSMEEQALYDEASNGDVLALVYSYVPPGGRQNVHDLLAPELESAIGGSPWVLARLDDKMTLVSFHPDGEPEEGAPIYEFAVDVEAQTVTASPETIRNLRGGVAAAR